MLKSASSADGEHGDGDGLALRIKGNRKSWILRLRDDSGKRIARGIGSYPEISVKDARRKADAIRSGNPIASDPDPVQPEETVSATPASITFRETAHAMISAMGT